MNMRRPFGFSFVEVLLYVLFIGGMLVVFAGFVIDTLDDRTRGVAALEVQQNSRLATERMLLEIRAAKSIRATSSTFDANLALPINAGKVLSLEMASSTLNPTEFDVAGNILRIRQGATSTFTPLTSNEAQVTNLTFRNLSDGGSRHVGLTLTVEFINPGGRATVYAASTTIRTSVELRNR